MSSGLRDAMQLSSSGTAEHIYLCISLSFRDRKPGKLKNNKDSDALNNKDSDALVHVVALKPTLTKEAKII
jgi:hypothetical protein